MKKVNKTVMLCLSLMLLIACPMMVSAKAALQLELSNNNEIRNISFIAKDDEITDLEATADPLSWVNARLIVNVNSGEPFNEDVVVRLINDYHLETFYLYAINNYEYHFQIEPGLYNVEAEIVNNDGKFEITDIPEILQVESGMNVAASLNITVTVADTSLTEEDSNIIDATSSIQTTEVNEKDKNITVVNDSENDNLSSTIKNMGLEALGLSILLAVIYYVGNKIYNKYNL